MPADKLSVVLCWHMHQPDYRNLRTGEYRLPWTFLHVIKDYTDMAHHLENHPQARAVVNFAPVLLEQIEDYSRQVQGLLKQGSPIHDPLLAALVDATPPTEATVRQGLIKACLRAQRERQINRHPNYRRLAELADWLQKHPDDVRYLSSQYLVDLIVWYHLAWLGESIQRNDSRAKRLIERGHGYTLEDRRKLLELIGEHLGTVVARYRALAEKGQIELSVTPYAHPILPLLIDLNSALEAMPDARMPLLERYPAGEARGRWHIEKGLETFERFFGFRPRGCWPAEGGVSTAALQLLGAAGGFRWAASGGNVLRNSLAASQALDQSSACAVFRPYRVTENPIACFFRDDGLSDLIGFKYADWHADDAVGDLVKHLENIAGACGKEKESIVPIIMDGENAWEHYPHNGYYFLDALYERLANHPDLELTTFSAYLDQHPDTRFLRRMVAGSWVYGTFSTWIGDTDKNRAWDLLGAAKRVFDRVTGSGRLKAEQVREAEMQLAVCEGSDWFWWFGDYNPEEIVSDFERQFRLNLANLYLLLGEEPPHTLAEVFSHGGGAPLKGGAMRPGNPGSGG